MATFASDQQPIRLALIGAGIFARDVHLPALQVLDNKFDIVAVFSRTRETATKLVNQISIPVNIYTDLSALLARDDIEAVDILLPLDVMPTVVEAALRSGKHVISEKPVAPDVATGQRLLATYAQCVDQVWMVAENWRYEDAFEQAAEIVHNGQIGRPLLCHWALHLPITPENKYYHTDWRRASAYPGGYLLDVGVHHMAALRMVLGEIVEVSAITTQIRSDLSPADSLSAILQLEGGVIGSYMVSYATGAPWPSALHITGERASLSVDRGQLELIRADEIQTVPVTGFQGVETELADFAAAVRQTNSHRNPPEQALQDLAVIEAMLRSAEIGCRVMPEQFVGDDE